MSNAILKLDELTIRFGGLTAVNQVSLQVNEKELVGLIGPNGAGKTTCFNMITGVYTPTKGRVQFLNEEVQGVKPHLISRKGMSRTFQNIRLFKEMTVLENVMLSFHNEKGYHLIEAILRLPKMRARERAMREESMELLKRFGLEHRAENLAKNLPYGEQRKLEIARALATRPKLLLLDEPAAGMNPSETANLSELILKIREDFGTTILLIEHDMSLVMKICERIYVLDYGELIASGKPEEVRNNPKVIEAYLGGGFHA